MNQEIRRRGEGLARPDSLLTDDFWKKIAQKRGIQLGEDGKPVKAKDVDVEQLHATWSKEHVDPLKAENGQLKEQNSSLLEGMKLAGILQAAEKARIKAQFRTRPDKNTPSAVEAMFAGVFGYDTETRDFATKYAQEAFIALDKSLGFAMSVARGYTKEPNEHGNTIHIDVPSVQLAEA